MPPPPTIQRVPPPVPPQLPAAPRIQLTDLARWAVVVTLVVLLLLGVAFLLWHGIHVLLQAFAGMLFALFLATVSRWVSDRTGISYHWALTAVVVGLLLLFAGLAWLLANRLAMQIGELTQTLPKSWDQLRGYLTESAWGQLLLAQLPTPDNPAAAGDGLSRVTGLISSMTYFVTTIVVILFVGIFGAADPEMYRAGLLHLVPPAYRPRAGEAVDTVVFNLRWWLVGQLLLMVMIGATTAVGLWLLGVPLALSLGLIAGILELIPYVGPWISAVPAALVALVLSPWHLIAVLGLYLALHILEGYVLMPLVQQKAVALPPALTLVAQVLLGELLGILGVFVAAPLTVVGVVLMKMLYVEDTLDDQAVEVPGEPGKEPAVARAG